MTEPTTRRKRAKATTPLGRSILQKERQRLAREQAKLGESFTLAARQRIAEQQHIATRHTPEAIAVNRGMVRRVAAVLASEHVNVPITTQATSGQFSAWTDFDVINVTYHLHDDARLTAAILRGMLYHEGGHVRFTIPFPDLMILARDEYQRQHGIAAQLPEHPDGRSRMQFAWNVLEDQRMETAVTSDSPRKAIYLTPMVMAELMKDVNAAKDNWPLLVWRRYLPKHLRDTARSYWVTEHGIDKAVEVEETVSAYVTAETALDMWLAVIQMTEHLKQAPVLQGHFGHERQYGSGDSDAKKQEKLVIPIDPGMLDEETLQAIKEHLEEQAKQQSETPVSQDVPETKDEPDCDLPSAKDEDDSWLPEEPEVVYELPIENLDAEPVPSHMPSNQSYDEDEDEAEDESGSNDSSPSEGIQGSGDITDNAEGDSKATGNTDSNTQENNESSDSAGSTGAHEGDYEAPPEKSFQEELDEALESAETERYEDKALDGDVEAYEQAKWDTDSTLLPYVAGVEDDGELIAVAENVAYEIEQAFQANTLDRAPAWVEGQRRGALNVLRYETAQPGDAEFYRNWQDDDQPGFDIAVSVLLDYSGSMQAEEAKLAQSGWACKAACDRLDIPCSVLLWDTDARTLWDAHERAIEMPRISVNGGTDPTVALADLDAHRMERSKHLVLIFTDGSWSGSWGDGSKTLFQYKNEGRKIISFVDNEHYIHQQKNLGADECYAITDLMEIPRRLEQALIEVS